jgi:transcriptional regulator with GAF, ATPase, and Fis domain
MTAVTASQAFADAAAAMVQQHDTTDTLAHLLTDYAELSDAAAAGILVKDSDGQLELLSASSHQAVELELYQLQHDTGPCVEAVHQQETLSAYGEQQIVDRWGTVGTAIVAAGYHCVIAVPMRWRGVVIGAMNSFHTGSAPLSEDTQVLTQTFADFATVVIVQSTELTAGQLDERVSSALGGRTVVEQAKGVLAYTAGVDMAGAYRLLVQRAAESATTLTETATQIVRQAQHRA